MVSHLTTPREWFQEAAQCYVERHQGCPWCHGAHRVYHLTEGMRSSYYCQVCDFHAIHDTEGDHYICIPGEETQHVKRETMCELSTAIE